MRIGPPGGPSGRRLAVFACTVVLAVVAVLVIGRLVGPLSSDSADKAASVIGAGAGVLALLGTVWVWALRRPPPPSLPTAELLANAEDNLADRMMVVCRTEFPSVEPTGTDRLAVPFEVADPRLMDRWENIGDSGRHEAIELRGRSSGIVDRYRRVPSGRLVVLGSAGAGKTVVAHQLAYGLLDKPRPGDRVPVVVPLASWNPEVTTTLRDWVSTWVGLRWPPLAGPAGDDRTLIMVLWDRKRILPILDGFDEMPPALRVRALERIDATPGPFVLTSRPEEFAAAVEGWGRRLGRTVAIALRDVPFVDVADYLRRAGGSAGERNSRWEPVIARVTGVDRGRRVPAGRPTPGPGVGTDPVAEALAGALTRPLMAGMAHAIFRRQSADPSTLLGLPADRRDIERHLLRGYVPAAYDRDGDGPATPPEGTSAHRSVRTLSFLADGLSRQHSTSLAWWRLPTLLPRGERVLALSLVGGGLISAGYGLVLLVILLIALAPTLADGHGPRLWTLLSVLGVAAAVAAMSFAGMAILIPLVFGLRRGALVLSRRQVRIRNNLGRLARQLVRNGGRALATCLGLAFVGGNIGGFLGLVCGSFGYERAKGIALAAAIGAAIGTQIGLIASLVALASTADDIADMPADLTQSITPGALLRSERRLALARSAGIPLALSVLAIIAYLPLSASGVKDIGRFTAVSWLGLAPLAPLWLITCTAWGHFLVARIWFAARRRTPLRLMAFLSEAHRRGVLRQVGSEYEFRHGELRDLLAELAPRPARRLAKRVPATADRPDGPPEPQEPYTPDGPDTRDGPQGTTGAVGPGVPEGPVRMLRLPRTRRGRLAAGVVVVALLANTATTATVLVRRWPRPTCAPGTAVFCVTWHAMGIGDVAFSRDGTMVATASCDGVRRWDARTGRPVGSAFTGHETCVNHVAYTMDGDTIVSTSSDRYLRRWRPGDGRSVDVDAGEDLEALSGNGERVAFTYGPRLSVRLTDSGARLGAPVEAMVGSITRVTFSADGRTVLGYLMFDPLDTTRIGVEIWNSGGRNPRLRLVRGQITGAGLSADGGLLATADDRALTLWDAQTLRRIRSVTDLPESPIDLIEFSPDGKLLLLATMSGGLELRDTAGLAPSTVELSGHTGGVQAAAFAPDGTLVATVGDDLALRMWRTGR